MPDHAGTAAADMTLAHRVLELIQMGDAATKKAEAFEASHTALQEKIAKLIPQVTESLVANDRIRPDQREKLAEQLRDPLAALGLLEKLASHRTTAELAHMGAGQPDPAQMKTAAARRNYVGAPASGVSESDARFFAGLGLPVPQG